jgi:hypothetical protein
MCGRKDATAGGGARKGLGLHYKPSGAFGGWKTTSFLRNPHTVPANFFKNLVQYRKLG